jgi:predicted membrane chloride channel (bestrophin family)
VRVVVVAYPLSPPLSPSPGYVPLSLYSAMGPVGSGIASAFITFLLLGVEDIGVSVEDPNRLLPLEEICDGIEKHVLEMEGTAARLANAVAVVADSHPPRTNPVDY